MRVRRLLLLLVVAVLLVNALTAIACNRAPAPAAPPPPEYRTTATIKDIMDSLVDPSADTLWESVATIVSAAGVEERAPKTDDQWKTVHRAAVSLVEATNLLMMPGRQVAKPGEKSENPGIELQPEEILQSIDSDRADFYRLVGGLYDAAMPMLKATEARDAKGIFDAGEALDTACENCHIKYWYPEGGKPVVAPSMRK